MDVLRERDPRYKHALRARAAELYRELGTLRSVAAVMGISHERVRQLLMDTDVEVYHRGVPVQTEKETRRGIKIKSRSTGPDRQERQGDGADTSSAQAREGDGPRQG